jgi:hypothetical protein
MVYSWEMWGGRGRASLGVKVWKPYQKWSVERSAVRSIAWLSDVGFMTRPLRSKDKNNPGRCQHPVQVNK